jgi:hypothetical protein
MGFRRRALLAVLVAGFVVGTAGLQAGMAAEPVAPDPCTDTDAGLDPACLPEGTAGHLLRQACDYQWVEELCASTRLEDPGYVAHTDPSSGQPLVQRVGAVHEHSSYSDGDPSGIPADYFTAGRTGINGNGSGVQLDFIFSSEHSDNAQIPITTAATCADPMGAGPIPCNQVDEGDHYWKWPATLRQAREGSDATFTGVRGFEWTNDYFNHMNVYFSRNFRNVKIDGSYLSMDVMWNWLRRPADQGGGDDGLVTFNHPGGDPALTPFDGGQPHNQLLAQLGNSNWNDVAYVPDVDDNVAGMEVRNGDDLAWFLKALTKGWHIGPVGQEDEHGKNWASANDSKTLILTRGRSPRDYYFAMQRHRTVTIGDALVNGAPGTPAVVPTIYFYANGKSVQDRKATLLGSTIERAGRQRLVFEATGLPSGARLALLSNTGVPVPLGAAGTDGAVRVSASRLTPVVGEDWYFVVVCPAESGAACGTDESYVAATAPIWLRAPAG